MMRVTQFNRVALAAAAFLMATTVVAAPALAETPAAPAFKATPLPAVERVSLANGLDIILLPSSKNPIVEIHLVAKVGTAIDGAERDGLVSLMAAMLTKGTATQDEAAISQAIEAVGGTLHASADMKTVELSGSVVTLNVGDLERFQTLFADMALRAAFPEDALKRTKALRVAGIQRLQDNSAGLADAALDTALYPNSARGRLGIGTAETVPGFMAADLRAARDAVFQPGHSVIAVAGDFDRDAMMAWIQTQFGADSWGAGRCERTGDAGPCAKVCAGDTCFEIPGTVTPPTSKRRVILIDRQDPSLNQIQWRMGQHHGVGLTDGDWGAFRLGTQILGGDFTARLNAVLRVREGLTYGARFPVDWAMTNPGPARVSTYVSPKDVGRAITLAMVEMNALISASVEAAEVEGFKAKINNAFPFKFETISDTLQQFLYLEAGGVPLSWLAEYEATIGAVDAAMVFDAMKAHLNVDTMTIVAVGNLDLVEQLKTFGPVEVVTASDFIKSGLSTAVPAAAAASKKGK